MSSIQNKIVDAVFEGNEELTRSLVRDLSYVKTRKILGLLESGDVTIRGNDIFVGGNTVGSFETKDDVIQFTATDGAVKTFENDEELMNYVSGLTEDMKEVKAPEGYTSHSLSSKHKDPRMENPSNHNHGHDSKSEEPKASGGGSNPPDKVEDLKKNKHKDPRMENPSNHNHGHDSKSEEPKASGGGSNPPDKQTKLKSHDHTPSSKTHGHDDPKGVGKVQGKVK